MFKKSLLICFLFSAAALATLAQPVLNTDVLPNIGQSVYFYEADTNGVSHGQAGANQTWNFGSLDPVGDPVLYQYISPVGTPYLSDFPGATIVTKVVQDTAVYAYLREQSSQYELLGAASLTFIQDYTNPDAQLKYPTNYNGTFQDNFEYTTDAGTGVLFHSKGGRTVKYDGYGQLITPFGFFQQAIRIKSEASQVDSAAFFGTEIINHTDLTAYAWLVSDYPGTMVSVYYTKLISETRIPGFDTIFTEYPVVKAVNYVSAPLVNTIEAGTLNGFSGFEISPNPASDLLRLRFNTERAESGLQLRITDVSGRTLLTQNTTAAVGENTLNFPVGDYTPGLYFLTLTDGKGMQTLRWYKQ
jgi:hypothetical protein